MILGLRTNPQQLALDHVLFIRLKAYNSRNWIVFDSEHSPEMGIFEPHLLCNLVKFHRWFLR